MVGFGIHQLGFENNMQGCQTSVLTLTGSKEKKLMYSYDRGLLEPPLNFWSCSEIPLLKMAESNTGYDLCESIIIACMGSCPCQIGQIR